MSDRQSKSRRSERQTGDPRLRALASVNEVLREPALQEALEQHPHALVVDAVRTVIERLRSEIRGDEHGSAHNERARELTAADLVPWVCALLDLARTPSLQRVINATGVVVHTNLGRSVLPREAVDAVTIAASGGTNLEYGLARGERASRQDHVHDILCTLTGAADALAVNNCAAAVLLALAATSRGGEVLVSRGQLVEIGDSFRIPDILRESGAELVEVGTTNRTYLRDYEAAWNSRTKAILRVHTSNYRIIGFTAEPPLTDLAALAHSRDAVLIDDLGSGALADIPLFDDEPLLRESVAVCDIVTFSGDKLLGGPQAGLAIGSGATIGAMRRHPLARAVRIDKLDLAALDATLRLYLDPDEARRSIPTLAALSEPVDEVRRRAERLRTIVAEDLDDAGTMDLVDTVARAGAGALPLTELPSVALQITPLRNTPHDLATRLRTGRPAVVCRVSEERLLFDLRAVRDHELGDLARAICNVFTE